MYDSYGGSLSAYWWKFHLWQQTADWIFEKLYTETTSSLKQNETINVNQQKASSGSWGFMLLSSVENIVPDTVQAETLYTKSSNGGVWAISCWYPENSEELKPAGPDKLKWPPPPPGVKGGNDSLSVVHIIFKCYIPTRKFQADQCQHQCCSFCQK